MVRGWGWKVGSEWMGAARAGSRAGAGLTWWFVLFCWMVHYLKSIYNHVSVEKGVSLLCISNVEDYEFGVNIA